MGVRPMDDGAAEGSAKTIRFMLFLGMYLNLWNTSQTSPLFT